MRSLRRKQPEQRRGTTLVEMAVVLPVFAVFLVAIMEFGHAFLVVGTLNAAAKQAARHGAVDGITTEEVVDRAEEILGAAFDASQTTILVKDASVFDTEDELTEIDYAELDDIELSTAERRQLYVVRIEVDYDDVAIMPPFWAKEVTLVGQSVMRHE
jgi:Flp pilus assembly protein TadG